MIYHQNAAPTGSLVANQGGWQGQPDELGNFLHVPRYTSMISLIEFAMWGRMGAETLEHFRSKYRHYHTTSLISNKINKPGL